MVMETESARRQMVEQQIRTWDVFDANVLHAFGAVPRDQFVPADCAAAAYADTEIPLPHNQCMLRPSIVGRILQSLEIQPDDTVLEIGTGTGYLTACLAQLAGFVTTVDIFEDFIRQAKANLADAEIENFSAHCMDAMNELPDGMFDAIVVTGSLHKMDERIIAALKPGGRLFAVVGESPAKSATLVRRTADAAVETRELFETDIPALLTTRKPTAFSF